MCSNPSITCLLDVSFTNKRLHPDRFTFLRSGSLGYMSQSIIVLELNKAIAHFACLSRLLPGRDITTDM